MATEENPLTRGAESNFIERAYFGDHSDVSGGVVTGFRDTLRQVLDSAALLAAFGFSAVNINGGILRCV